MTNALVGALPAGYAEKPKEIEFKGRKFFEVEWPVFKPCSRRNPVTGQIDPFDKQWIERAAHNQNVNFQKGYLAPVHVGHRKPSRDDPDQAGFLGEARVSDHDGVPTMFTKAYLTPEAFEQVDKLYLPYRSVEILDPATPDISSLALLKTQVPFFKFGLPGLQKFEDRASSATLFFHAEDEFFDSRLEIVFAVDDLHPLLFEDEDESDAPKKKSAPPKKEDTADGPPEGDFGGGPENVDPELLAQLSDEELMQLLAEEDGGAPAEGEDEFLGGGLGNDLDDPFAGGGDPFAGGDPLAGGGLADPGMEPVPREEFEDFARTISDQIASVLGGPAMPTPKPPVI